MLLFTDKTIVSALENVHFQFHLGVLLLSVLYAVTVQVKRVLDLLCPDIVFFQLTAFDGELALS